MTGERQVYVDGSGASEVGAYRLDAASLGGDAHAGRECHGVRRLHQEGVGLAPGDGALGNVRRRRFGEHHDSDRTILAECMQSIERLGFVHAEIGDENFRSLVLDQPHGFGSAGSLEHREAGVAEITSDGRTSVRIRVQDENFVLGRKTNGMTHQASLLWRG